MSTVEDRLTDALAARAQLEGVDDDVLRQHQVSVGVAAGAAVQLAADGGTPAHDLDGDRGGSGPVIAVAGDGAAPPPHRRRRAAVVLAAAAAVLLVVASSIGLGRWVDHGSVTSAAAPAQLFAALRTPQQPSDLGPDNDLPDEVDRDSIRLVGAVGAVSFWAGVTSDHQVCFGAGGTRARGGGESGGTCTLHGLMHPSAGPQTALEVQLESLHVDAWFVTDAYDTTGLRRRGFTRVAPNLWVDARTVSAPALADVQAASDQTFLVPPRLGHGTEDLPAITTTGAYAVIVRCLTDAPITVQVDGAADEGPGACAGGMRSLGREGTGSPAVVTISAADDAPWAAGIVLCRPIDGGTQC